jgi:hypothetical protein
LSNRLKKIIKSKRNNWSGYWGLFASPKILNLSPACPEAKNNKLAAGGFEPAKLKDSRLNHPNR